MKLSSLNSVAAVLTVSLASVAQAQTVSNPFMAQPLSTIVVADNHEGKCGAMKESSKEGSCGGMKETAKEGKCGEGKCGGQMKADAKVSKAEFMSRHEAMFNEADSNKDGMLDANEHKALHKVMKQKMKGHKEGKCGEGKCGASKK
ncbi:MAG: hypothetical protein U1E94_04650 [Agitococcus sp.]